MWSRRSTGTLGAAAPALAVLAAAAVALPLAAAVKGITDWSAGMTTHFGGAQDGESPPATTPLSTTSSIAAGQPWFAELQGSPGLQSCRAALVWPEPVGAQRR